MENYPNPYVGPSPFGKEDAPRFYGRSDEATELYSLTRAHSVVLFYSQSGAGKTSLINAGVIPKLQKERYEVFPVARIGVKLPKDVDLTSISNVFVFNTLLSLEGEQKRPDFDQLGKMSLSEYLKEGASNGKAKYSYPLRVLIFDQFEELFTTFPEHWARREDFFISISEALEQDPLLRIVFAMREDYIAELEPFAPMLPLRFQKRFRLERLRKDAARRAIEGPVENTSRSYAKNVAEGLVNNLLQEQIKYSEGTRATRGEFVEPVQLQIVCRSLWEELPSKVSVIDERAISQFGDVNIALARYYDRCLIKTVANTRTNEAGLRHWFEHSLITPVNTRATAYVDEGSTMGISPSAIEMLEEQRLIRPEFRGGAKWYELTHDRFIEPILKSNKEWFNALPEADSFIRSLEEKALSWKNGGEKVDTLLPEHVIQKFKDTAKYNRELTQLTPSPLLEKFVAASETSFVKKKSKAKIRTVLAIAIGIVSAVALIAYSIVANIRITQAKKATIATQVEKGRQAQKLADLPGSEFDGLVQALDGARLSDPEDAPRELVEGLAAALSAVDRKVWLRYPISSATRPERLQLSTDGTLALTVNTNELCVWNTLTGEKTFAECIPCDRGGEWGKTQFSPDGKLVYALVKPLALATPSDSDSSRIDQGPRDTPVTKLEQSFVMVADARTGELIAKVQAKLKGVRGFYISNNSGFVLADFGKPGVQIIDVNNSDNVYTPSLADQSDWYQIALLPDGAHLLAVYAGRKIELLAKDGLVKPFLAEIDKSSKVDVISFSPDGKYGVLVRPGTTGSEGAGFVWENASGRLVVSFKTKARNVHHAEFSADNSLILVSDETRREVFNVSTGAVLSSAVLPSNRILLHAGVKTLVLQNGKNMCTISVWDGPSQTPSIYNYANKSSVSMAESTPEGNKVVVLDENNTIQVWSLIAPLETNERDMEKLITSGCKKLLDRKSEFTQFNELCKSRVESWQ